VQALYSGRRHDVGATPSETMRVELQSPRLMDRSRGHVEGLSEIVNAGSSRPECCLARLIPCQPLDEVDDLPPFVGCNKLGERNLSSRM